MLCYAMLFCHNSGHYVNNLYRHVDITQVTRKSKTSLKLEFSESLFPSKIAYLVIMMNGVC